MKEVKVHTTKSTLITGIITIIISSLSLFFIVLNCHSFKIIIAFIIFGLLNLFGLFLILSYNYKQVIINSEYISYTTLFNKSYIFSYTDIKGIQSQYRGFYQIISKENKKIASFNSYMIGTIQALSFLHKKDIKFIETNKNDLQIKLNQLSWSQKQIKKAQKIIKLINYLLTIFVLISIFLPLKISLTIILFIILFNWIIYIYLYPTMTLYYFKNNISDYIPFPISSTIISIILSLEYTNNININKNDFIFLIMIYSFIFLVPYFMMLIIRKKKEKFFQIIFIIGVSFFLSFSTIKAFNYLMTFSQYKHKTIQVIDKQKSYSKYSTNYHFKIEYQGKIKDMSVSKKIYDSTHIYDNVQICIRESIFHFQYYIIHK